MDYRPLNPTPAPAIQSHADGVITFHREHDDGEWDDLFGIRREHLQGMFTSIREQLERDSYFSLNSFWDRDAEPHLLKTYMRRGSRLRYLCCSYVDIDCHKLGIDFWDAFHAVGR